jgi:hypothetical protein
MWLKVLKFLLRAAIAITRPKLQKTYLRHWLGVNRGNLEINNLQTLGSERHKCGGEIPVNT